MKISFRKARKGNTNNSGAKKKSKWKIRIEGKIGDIRRKIGILTSYLRDPEKASLRQKRLVDEIVVQHIGFAQQNKFNETLALQMDKFKQRLAALANLCRRYTEAESRRHQATLFSNDERKYYKLLNRNEHSVVQHPGVEDMEKCWKAIKQEPVMHNENAYWIDQVESKMRDLAGMPQCVISTEDVSIAVKKSHNWKAPGPDGIQNYWLKNFLSLQSKIAGCFNDLLQQRSEIPVGFASGLIFMIPKKEGNLSPGDYRPITCLNSTYKLMTSTLASKIDSHITLNKIMATEQLGCRKGAKGCKELLILDSFIAGQASAKQRNVSIAWIDYAKVFDSVPHSWLLYVLQLYKVDEALVNLMRMIMSQWSVKLKIRSGETQIQTESIQICQGIYQGDSLSSLWFCLALNPLSLMLEESTYGYKIEVSRSLRVSHSFYMVWMI
ncbi:uncharacterized protein LOC120354622 [Nilaparvata lugens]|uniref:uncharacterized protein LOC120354622 n=1 Tax=Nilaparvata lugens TaxID=108931 RepID=UPI00193D7A69|nr:uncharacterized protein LOC120354622 [Nilaparvata lugens]